MHHFICWLFLLCWKYSVIQCTLFSKKSLMIEIITVVQHWKNKDLYIVIVFIFQLSTKCSCWMVIKKIVVYVCSCICDVMTYSNFSSWLYNSALHNWLCDCHNFVFSITIYCAPSTLVVALSSVCLSLCWLQMQ